MFFIETNKQIYTLSFHFIIGVCLLWSYMLLCLFNVINILSPKYIIGTQWYFLVDYGEISYHKWRRAIYQQRQTPVKELLRRGNGYYPYGVGWFMERQKDL